MIPRECPEMKKNLVLERKRLLKESSNLGCTGKNGGESKVRLAINFFIKAYNRSDNNKRKEIDECVKDYSNELRNTLRKDVLKRELDRYYLETFRLEDPRMYDERIFSWS